MTEPNILSCLPKAFLSRMKEMLGNEYDAFLESYTKPRTFGLRLNTAKISAAEFEKIVPFPVAPIPWVKNAYFYPADVRPSRCPLYQAGLYYLQEPSAMTPASCLPAEPGDVVLDLCAAPGGKATALGAALQGEGLLVANDISASRTRALLRNLELFGVTNSLIVNETPARLLERFPAYFNKILLDAPCSGEGMFRKEEALAKDWTPEKSRELSQIQRELILQAADMLRPGGLLLYSTCTFAPAEDEGAVSWLLENRPDMKLLEIPQHSGFSPGVPGWGNDMESLKRCVRLFPHKIDGEGHFMALLKKDGTGDNIRESVKIRTDPATEKWLRLFFDEIGLRTLGGKPFDFSRVETKGDKVYYLPPASADFRGLVFLRNGLYLGDLKKNRFEPSQPFALALHKGDVAGTISLPVSDPRLERYLKGETLNIAPGEAAHGKGWHLLCVEGWPLGFGKLVNQTLKNKYPAGWRL